MKKQNFKLLTFTLLTMLFIGCGGSSSSNDTLNPSDKNISSNREAEEINDKNITNNSDQEQYKKSAYLASSEADYIHLKIKKNRVEPWEDALRTDGKQGSFEWWYSDFLFSDGTSVVVVFYTKLSFDTRGPAQPMATIHIKTPDGLHDKQEIYLESLGSTIHASKSLADVHIGKSYFTYDSGDYLLHFENNNLTFDAKMISTLPLTRPKTGHIFFGKDRAKYLAWLPAQASSKVNATLKYSGESEKHYVGVGYHDHNWGNTPMNEIINSWYWGRAIAGEYTIIFSEVIATTEYNNSKIPFFILAKGDQFIDLNGSITIQKNEIVTHPKTNKPYAKQLIFSQNSTEGKTYTITTQTKKDLVYLDMNRLPFDIGNSPTYISSRGDINLTVTDKKGKKKITQGKGIWEQISFDDTIIP